MCNSCVTRSFVPYDGRCAMHLKPDLGSDVCPTRQASPGFTPLICALLWQVYLNGEVLPVRSFQEYCELYLGDKLTGGPREYLKVNDRWEVCVAPTEGQFQQVRCMPYIIPLCSCSAPISPAEYMYIYMCTQ